ncbi:hypothetical protein G7046_g7302 [Stylonectria norvegica]|nr:hypothetical protein G7046_g7302 [Stylonectria norvegica]
MVDPIGNFDFFGGDFDFSGGNFDFSGANFDFSGANGNLDFSGNLDFLGGNGNLPTPGISPQLLAVPGPIFPAPPALQAPVPPPANLPMTPPDDLPTPAAPPVDNRTVAEVMEDGQRIVRERNLPRRKGYRQNAKDKKAAQAAMAAETSPGPEN